MNNEEAYNFYTTKQKSFSQISREFIAKYNVDESHFDCLRLDPHLREIFSNLIHSYISISFLYTEIKSTTKIDF